MEYVDVSGNYMGNYDVAPSGGILVSSPPLDAKCIWNGTVWTFPPAAMAPYISLYRDEKTTVAITVGGHTVLNDDQTRSRLLQKLNSLLLWNDSTVTVLWKCINGSFNLTLPDLQGLYLACDEKLQKGFDAQAAVTAIHAVTPYASIAAMKTAFDSYM